MKSRVLLVDDDPDVLDWLERALGGVYSVERAESVAAAETALSREAFVALITDEHMPGARGVELCARARLLHPQMARILVSGFSDDPTLRAALRSGDVHRLVVKPVESAILRDVIEATVRAAAMKPSE